MTREGRQAGQIQAAVQITEVAYILRHTKQITFELLAK